MLSKTWFEADSNQSLGCGMNEALANACCLGLIEHKGNHTDMHSNVH